MDPDGKIAILPLIYWYVAAIMSSPDSVIDLQMLSMDIAQGRYGDATLDAVSLAIPALSGLSAGAKAAQKAATLFANSVKGRAFEKAGLKLLGMVKNTIKVDGRIADVLLKDGSGAISAIIEFKNCAKLYSSKQLSTFIQQAGKNFSLIVNGSTNISTPLWNEIEKAGGHIYRMVGDKLTKIL